MDQANILLQRGNSDFSFRIKSLKTVTQMETIMWGKCPLTIKTRPNSALDLRHRCTLYLNNCKHSKGGEDIIMSKFNTPKNIIKCAQNIGSTCSMCDQS